MVCAARCRGKAGRRLGEAKGSSSGGGSRGETASSTVTADREQGRRRLLAFAALWLFLAGLLTALSFVVVVLVATAVLVLIAIVAGGVWLLSRAPVRHAARTAFVSVDQALAAAVEAIGRSLRSLWTRAHQLGVRERARRARSRARAMATDAPDRTHALVTRSGQGYARAVYRSTALTSRLVDAGGRLVSSLDQSMPTVRRRRRALRLNERGAQLRRSGNHEQAAAQHRVALAILRDLGDHQGEAMTLNNLALALAQGGAEEAAVQHLEQALALLRQLGDEEHEGQVIANLGLVHRRQGRIDEAVALLNAALEKLSPESPAYRQIEEQIRRAS
jgi:tetratricopeptide (TPR) repeat protein